MSNQTFYPVCLRGFAVALSCAPSFARPPFFLSTSVFFNHGVFSVLSSSLLDPCSDFLLVSPKFPLSSRPRPLLQSMPRRSGLSVPPLSQISVFMSLYFFVRRIFRVCPLVFTFREIPISFLQSFQFSILDRCRTHPLPCIWFLTSLRDHSLAIDCLKQQF
ncbi:uncharacterized protein PHACADRAFT_260850 [Phanerochaete carnosa HHB-10118-sp]|uniref:Uncharacterized protein n=1 Tax=Phanerochaete carnosa (strain HHB-10118-sp) TaxID=650164 RepID=K5W041_PHACS|nr:uncharacterized protein PHACADRAFT_260850 [Phanerochaete carnosa HHB-10118-sp]EKM52450.1 hypothetical protein PHACADRAFT_260850 [Phanerochaete carnosa HHB-10118-sp]